MKRFLRGLIAALLGLAVAALNLPNDSFTARAAPPNSPAALVLESPLLLTPGTGLTINDSTPTFVWLDVPLADTYQIQVDNNSDFSSPEIDTTVGVSTFTAASSLANGTYSWRVKASNTIGDFSDWSAPSTMTLADDNRQDIDLDSGWLFHLGDVANAQTVTFNDSSWTQLDLPHTWNNLDGQDGGNNYFRGIGWYRKHTTIPTTYAGKRIFVRFEAVSKAADVYVNGTLAGRHEGAFAAFVFDITNLVTLGADNVIAVKADNSLSLNIAPLSGDFNQDGGIFRPAHLLVMDKVHVTPLDFASPGVYLTQTNVSAGSANLQVAVKVDSNSSTSEAVSVVTTVKDATNADVATLSSTQTLAASASATFTQSTTITNPHLWDGRADPYLYHTMTVVKLGNTVVDQVVQPLGFRFFHVDPNTGFSLNGHPYDLHGVAMHEGRADKGRAISDADRAQDMGLIMEMGATFIRLAHYQHSETIYTLADQDGLVLSTEVPLVNNASTATTFTNNIQQQLKELIRQNYNHPSILFWGLYNELSLSSSSISLVNSLNTLAHAEDATRPTTAANPYYLAGSTAQMTDLIGWNEYFGWYSGASTDVTPALTDVHSFHPNLGVSEYGAGGSINQHEQNPAIPIPGSLWHPEEYQDLFHESYWRQLTAMPNLWEKTIWAAFDFAVDSRNEGDTPGRNDKGLISFDRTVKKDAFYWYKANWSSDPVVYITSRRFTARDNTMVEVKVYSNCDSVELRVNNASLGSLTSTDHIYRWSSVALGPGNNTVNAVCTLGGNQYQDSVVWDTGPALSPLPPGLYQQTDTRLVYSGQWTTLGGQSNPGPTYMTHEQNASVKFDFRGTEVRLYRTMDSGYGTMQTCVDGVCQTINNFSSTRLTSQMVVLATGLTNGIHRVVIRNLTTSFIDVDAVEVVGPPDPPALISPANGAASADNTPDFDWTDATGATQYHIQIASDQNFTTLVAEADTAVSSYTAATLPNGTYFWRVKAGNGQWSDYSDTWSMTIATPPDVPALISPADGSSTANTLPTFDWADSAGATQYQIEIDDNADFSSPLISATTATSSYTPATPLGYHAYYWHVRASNGVWSNYSAAWRVIIATPPALSMPKNGSAVYTHSPKLTWKPASGAVGYRVRLTDLTDPGGTTETDVTGTSFVAGPLDFGTYTWQVATRTADGLSDYSMPFSFDVTLLKTPGKAMAISTRLPKFAWVGVKGATSYHLKVWKGETCGADLAFEADATRTSYTTPPTHVLALGAYTWQVTANSVDYTPCWRFDVTTLKAPKPGSAVPTTLPSFSWAANKLASGYALTVERTPDDGNAPSTIIDGHETTAPKYTATAADGLDFGRYLWHVSEKVGGVYGPATPDGEFYITVMSTPANHTFTLNGKVSFAWKKVPGATTYQLQVSEDPTDFDPPAFATSPSGALKLTSPILSRGVYYWRVVTDTGKIMPTWTLTVGP